MKVLDSTTLESHDQQFDSQRMSNSSVVRCVVPSGIVTLKKRAFWRNGEQIGLMECGDGRVQIFYPSEEQGKSGIAYAERPNDTPVQIKITAGLIVNVATPLPDEVEPIQARIAEWTR